MKKSLSLRFNAKIKSFEKLNDELTLCRCYIQGLGKNRNFSYFGIEATNKAIPSLVYIPVVGHLYEDEDGKLHMGGHETELVIENGTIKFKTRTVPYGVVPYQEEVIYEPVAEPDGSVVTYMVADIILWTGRYPELMEAVYDQNTYFGQSMEINYTDSRPYPEDKNYTEILEFEYSALCLLGKSDNPQSEHHYEPCFPEARVEPYFALTDDFSNTFERLKEECSKLGEGFFDKGGKDLKKLTKSAKEKILSSLGMTFDEIKVDTSEVETEEEFIALVTPERRKPTMDDDYEEDDELPEEPEPEEPEPEEPEPEEPEPEGTDGEGDTFESRREAYASTYGEKMSAVSEAVRSFMYRDEDVDWCYVSDMDDKFAFINFVIRKDDSYDEVYGRISYTFDEASKTATVDGEVEEMVVKWLTLDENRALEESRKTLDELIAFKASVEDETHKAQVDDILAGFEDLAAVEEFESLKEIAYSIEDLEELRTKCFAIRGKLIEVDKNTFSLSQPRKSSVKLPVSFSYEERANGASYALFYEKLGKKPKKD